METWTHSNKLAPNVIEEITQDFAMRRKSVRGEFFLKLVKELEKQLQRSDQPAGEESGATTCGLIVKRYDTTEAKWKR